MNTDVNSLVDNLERSLARNSTDAPLSDPSKRLQMRAPKPLTEKEVKQEVADGLALGAKPKLPAKKVASKKAAAPAAKKPAKIGKSPGFDAPNASEKKAAAKKAAAPAKKPSANAAAAKASDVEDNCIVLKALCQELKVEPRIARRKLRKAGISGHDFRDRWTFRIGSPAERKAREVLAGKSAE